MDDPELHSGERILLRTAGVHVKSISFEAILTNKRIILSDRSKNILPQKEIPLALIKTVDAGENAIREMVITLEVVSNGDRMRQMVLTFSRERGGNRAKERNEWVRLIKENLIPSFKQDSTVIPGIDPKETAGPVSPPKFKIVGSPLPQTPAAAHYKQATKPQPVNKIVASPPVTPWQVPSVPEAAAPAPVPPTSPSVTFGTYCSRCGNKVPDGSGFCNKCGSKIIVVGEPPQVPVAIPTPATYMQTVKKEQPIDLEIRSAKVSLDPQDVIPPQPAIGQKEQETPTTVAPVAARPQKRFMSRLFSPKDLSPPPHVPTSVPLAKPRRRKKLVIALGIVIVIIIAVVAVAVVLPKAGFVESILSGFNSSGPSTTIANSTGTIAMTPTTETIVPITQVTAATTIPVIINQAASIMTSVTEKITTPTPAIINQAVSIMT